jgi:hypothetical protein
MSIITRPSTMDWDVTRSMLPASSWVRSRTSWLNVRAVVTTAVTNCITTPTLTSARRGTTRPSTLERLEARARALDRGLYFSRRIAASTISRVSFDMGRFPLIT